jgi:hypothetical protein
MRKSKGYAFYVLTTASCNAPAFRSFRAPYVKNELSTAERISFRKHLLMCVACAAAVYNDAAAAARATSGRTERRARRSRRK